MNDIQILGAPTLTRFTQLLQKGFEENGLAISSHSKNILMQIHGAKDAEAEDKKLIEELSHHTKDDGKNFVVLVHRPDELKDRFPDFQATLSSLQAPITLCFLGKLFMEDPFYQHKNVTLAVMPHGFFDSETPLQVDPIVVGSQTRWTDMRSTKHVINLLGNLFMAAPNTALGYIGGIPNEELSLEKLQAEAKELFPDSPPSLELYNGVITKNNTILVNPGPDMPEGLSVTFNTQLYYYGNTVRLGEASGSMHSYISIPVILEMNGLEDVEGLEVIKVPYSNQKDLGSIDFAAGAKKIAEMIENKKYVAALEHNKEQSKKFNSKNVAKEYMKLFGN